MKSNLIITGGGTGGHFYPLIAVAEELNIKKQSGEIQEDISLFYFGSEPYNESDLAKKLKKLGTAKSRAAKRYEINVPIKMFRLNNDQKYDVVLSDLSLVGFGIKIKTHDIFKITEQVQIKIPTYRYDIFDINYGDFLKISGRLRRISIDSQTLGFSNEFLSSSQTGLLLKLIEKLAQQSQFSAPTIKKTKELTAAPTGEQNEADAEAS